MSREHSFKTIRDEEGDIIKMKASISNYKDVTLNCFNDKCYAHLSDVSKCFKQGGGFDLTKVKSVTLNREEVDTFIKMTKKLPSLMDKMLKVSDDSDGGSSSQTVVAKKSKKIKKKKSISSAVESDSDTENTTLKKERKKKRAHPYKKASSSTAQKKAVKESDNNSDDTDIISSD